MPTLPIRRAEGNNPQWFAFKEALKKSRCDILYQAREIMIGYPYQICGVVIKNMSGAEIFFSETGNCYNTLARLGLPHEIALLNAQELMTLGAGTLRIEQAASHRDSSYAIDGFSIQIEEKHIRFR